MIPPTPEAVMLSADQNMPKASRLETAFLLVKVYVWDKDIQIRGGKIKIFILALCSLIALLSELLFHYHLGALPKVLSLRSITIYDNVQEILTSDVSGPIARALLIATGFRLVVSAIIALLDITFYKKITGENFDYEGMINFAMVNVIFIFVTIFVLLNPLITQLISLYVGALHVIPTIVHLNGAAALIAACLIGDFCFYWSHRWCHGIRFFWNLGHINHHRSHKLSQLTYAVDPPSLLLNVAGGKVFALLLLPFITKLFSVDIRDAGWVLVAAVIFDALADPSHSVVLTHLETRSRALRMLRWIFVTPGVHFTHHAREKQFNLCNGSNFGARLTIWDRLFGTYAEPPSHVPEVGLFDDDADYCKTPIRFVLDPYVRLYSELKINNIKHWPAILFGSTAYNPPNPIESKSGPAPTDESGFDSGSVTATETVGQFEVGQIGGRRDSLSRVGAEDSEMVREPGRTKDDIGVDA
jgi:sterol desaturase/sphingolipid hydroxylase (fatty acid hydroxylase superfamily)